MKALIYCADKGLVLETDRPAPRADGEALIAVRYAGICSTDLEILKGYVPGYDGVLGHEFVGKVEKCDSKPELIGKRVVGEINCPLDRDYNDDDPIFLRNHYPRRTVLGIIARDGAMAEYTSLPVSNLFEVPEAISDEEAAFTEPLAAACRILEQQVIKQQDKVAVIGDGKLGLLVAQLLALQTKIPPVHFGRHLEKLDLVEGTQKVVASTLDELEESQKQAFDTCVEASGSSQGILLAIQLVRPLGTVIQKSTCSAVGDPAMPDWSIIANDVVVNEKHLIGSRCGPFLPALQVLQQPEIKQLLSKMLTGIYPISKGKEAIEKARTKGSLKVLLDMQDGT